MGDVVRHFLSYSNRGADFVFGNLAHRRPHANRLRRQVRVPLRLRSPAYDPLRFGLLTVLYHFGILQVCVRWLAKIMVYLMRTSGAETLFVSVNVFMGQTEAPLIVKPYLPG